MIVRCDHLRAVGILKHACCPDCHGPAGCVGGPLPDGHGVVYCCARVEPLTAEEVSVVLAQIPGWEARMVTPKYVQRLRGFLTEYQDRLKGAAATRHSTASMCYQTD